MGIEYDQTTWRMVFSAEPTDLQNQNTPSAEAIHTIVQHSEVRGIWPSYSAERINKSDFQAGVGINIVYTVPANKKLYIGSASLSGYESADGTSNCRLGLRSELDAWRAWLVYIYFTKAGQMTVPMKFAPALEALAGWDVFVESSFANIGCRGQIHGWLEDA